MATSSTVVPLKTALTAALVASIADPNVQVAYGRPQDHLKHRDAVFVGDVSYTANVANIKAGRKHYDESYSIDVVFACSKPRGTSGDAEGRAFELFEHLRDLLADDPTVGEVPGLIWAVLESVEAAVDHNQEGPVAVVVATVRCRGRVE